MVEWPIGVGLPVLSIGENSGSVGVGGRLRLSIEDISNSTEGRWLLRFEHGSRYAGLGFSDCYSVFRKDTLVCKLVRILFLSKDWIDRASWRFLLTEFRWLFQYLESFLQQQIWVVFLSWKRPQLLFQLRFRHHSISPQWNHCLSHNSLFMVSHCHFYELSLIRDGLLLWYLLISQPL